MGRIFHGLRSDNFLKNLGVTDFASRAAHLLAEINAVHPFREGNGRTQLALLSILVDTAGFKFDVSKLEPAKVLNAMIQSFSGKGELLAALILGLISERK